MDDFDLEARAGLLAGTVLLGGIVAAAVAGVAFDTDWFPILGGVFGLAFGVLAVAAVATDEYRKAAGHALAGIGWVLVWSYPTGTPFWVGIGALFVGGTLAISANWPPTAVGERFA